MPPLLIGALWPVLGPVPATLAAALTYEFVNGFHDASNAVAPLVKSRTLPYRSALIWSTATTLAPALLIGTLAAGVAHTIGGGLFAAGILTTQTMFAGVTAAFTWGLMTRRSGFPSSSSHALLGGLAGAAAMHAYTLGLPVLGQFMAPGWATIGAYMVGAPLIGGTAGYALSKAGPALKKWRGKLLGALDRHFQHEPDNHIHHLPGAAPRQDIGWGPAVTALGKALITPRKWPMLGMAAALNFVHSTNDAQKAMPIVAGAIYGSATAITPLVQGLCYTAITLGTLAGGRRIVDKLVHGFGREDTPKIGLVSGGVASAVLAFATAHHAPVSTSQIVGATTVGANAGHAKGNAHWKNAKKMAIAWTVTPVMSGLIAATAMHALDHFNTAAMAQQPKMETPKSPMHKKQVPPGYTLLA